jgi:hypothetical protein
MVLHRAAVVAEGIVNSRQLTDATDDPEFMNAIKGPFTRTMSFVSRDTKRPTIYR